MKAFSVTTPPKNPGLYALRNRVTGHSYVGQTTDLRRRWYQWAACFAGAPRLTTKHSAAMRKVLAGTAIEDWEFVVLEELPNATRTELHEKERDAIYAAWRDPAIRSLNETASVSPPKKGRPRKSAIIDAAGEEVDYGRACAVLGVDRRVIYNRVHYLRKKGATTIALSDLHSHVPPTM